MDSRSMLLLQLTKGLAQGLGFLGREFRRPTSAAYQHNKGVTGWIYQQPPPLSFLYLHPTNEA